ncbi:MAG: sulfatase-like hydrolase/transferase, partial [Planctomycetota bacterium]
MTALPLDAAHPREAVNGRPNIVWIVVEDMSLPFGCYGETVIDTPHVDQLAAEGAKFNAAFITAPVCSAARSALVTGMYQTSIGAHQHRSGRGTEKIHLDKHIKLIPQLFREAGYHTANMPSQKLMQNPPKR